MKTNQARIELKIFDRFVIIREFSMQSIFTANQDYEKTAFVNWRIHKDNNLRNLLNLADGYLTSALELANVCLQDNSHKRADILIFPILGNANHGIELYLKAINWMFSKLLGRKAVIEKTHNIQQLLNTSKALAQKHEGNFSISDFNAAMKNLEAYVSELFDKTEATNNDDKMDFSRYPFNNKDDNHFYVSATGSIEVDLENLVLRFSQVKETLESITDFLYYKELNLER